MEEVQELKLGCIIWGIISCKEIRRLSPLECERSQTVPDNYTEGISDTQRYKMLGNGWTVDVIAHIFNEAQQKSPTSNFARWWEYVTEAENKKGGVLMNIEKGQEIIEYKGVVNLGIVREEAIKIADKYRDIVLADNNIKEAKKMVTELKAPRKEIKAYRASVNKLLKSAIKDKLTEIDSITNIFNEVLQPLEYKIDEYAENIRIRKIETKKAEFKEQIDSVNNDLKEIAERLPYFEYQLIHFNDEWANYSLTKITNELNRQVENQRADIERKLERIDNIKTSCRLFQSEYELAGGIDWKQLRERMYESEWKDTLEDMAMTQQCQELSAIQRAEEMREIKEREPEPIVKLVDDDEESKITYVLELTSSITKAVELKKYLTDNSMEYVCI